MAFAQGSEATAPGYRADIDGLRAVAVLSVILFHAEIFGVGGGYVGVDVFFVISGYLIGQILLRDIDAGKFSLVSFYERRLRRIIPALMVMMAATFLVAAFFMMPRDFKELGESGLAASTFLSNVYFYLRADYFDTSAHYKPLLHTWSLAVEEQYYLVFPILLWALKRFLTTWTFAALAAFAFASFVFGVYQTGADPAAAFYLPFSRMWELLLGAMLAVRSPPTLGAGMRNAANWLGIALIGIAVLALTEFTPFPGYAALLPCVGAALIIGANGPGLVGRVLASAPMRGIGLISYSLYLWHWPIMSLLRYYYQREVPAAAWVAAFAALFVISYLSWRFVELPVRHDRARFTRPRIFVGAFAASALFVAIGAGAWLTRGYPQRLPAQTNAYAQATFDTNPRRSCDRADADDMASGDICAIGVEGGAPTFALIGDSMADSLAPGVDAAARLAGRSGVVLTFSGCYSLVDTVQDGDFCARHTAAVIDYLNRTPSIDTVIVVNRWSSAAEGSRFGEDLRLTWNFAITDAQSQEESPAENRRVLVRALDRTLGALAPRRIVLVGFAPEQPFDVPRRLGLQSLLGRPLDQGVSRENFEARQAGVREAFAANAQRHAFELIDLGERLCDDAVCRVLTPDNVPLYADDNHISASGAVYLAPAFAPAFAPLGAGPTATPSR